MTDDALDLTDQILTATGLLPPYEEIRSYEEGSADEGASFVTSSSFVPRTAWPTLDEAALHGLAGKVVATIEPHSEADPVALLLTLLVLFGAAVGDGPFAVADGARHPARLYVALVGRTSRARKGTAWANVRGIFAAATPDFVRDRVVSGLASGEGLIAAVADQVGDDGAPVSVDKRACAYEPELARVLTACAREGSTLSAILRDAWDRGDIGVLTRSKPLRATGAHIAVVSHITDDELSRTLTSTEIANGLANRFLFARVRRSKRLPEGGNLDEFAARRLGVEVGTALLSARKIGRLRRDPEARELWAQMYAAIPDADGLAGAITARAEAQLLRLSVIYALLDGSAVITVEHLRAAEGVWDYCRTSAEQLFAGSSGDPLADQLLAAITKAGSAGLDRQAQHAAFGRNVTAARLTAARAALVERGLIRLLVEKTSGRDREVAVAVQFQEVPTE